MRRPYLDDGDVRLYVGDCIEVMQEMDAESVDAVVCDPPYGLEFMGKDWDSFGADTRQRDDATFTSGNRRHGLVRHGIGGSYGGDTGSAMRAFEHWCEQWATEALRVLKPGGHLLAFGGTRTFHRLTCGLEDAGLEIRDCLSWLYGSGFPKSLDVSKAIDKAEGIWRGRAGEPISGNGAMAGPNLERTPKGDAVTDMAQAWEGWGTALKPAWEPCVVARKPLAGTVAENVQAHGTGAINVDGCRIGTSDTLGRTNNGREHYAPSSFTVAPAERTTFDRSDVAGGRWPANVALDEDAAAMLDAQTGITRSTVGVKDPHGTMGYHGGASGLPGVVTGYADAGGASRFYYTAKASRADRSTSGATNTHPTVKPTDLMRWLVRLVTPPGGVVLDPFAGSGSTLVAARAEGVRAVGIEREDEYARIIADRLAQLSLFSEGMGE